MHKRQSFIATLFIVLLVAGCAPVPQENGTYTPETFDPERELAPRTFASEGELRAFIEQHQGRQYAGGMIVRTMAADAAAESAPAAAGAKAENYALDRDFSTTNNQVADVDEADIIKTDGEYIYTVSGETLFIIKAYPGEEAAIVSSIELPGYPSGLFVEGDSLAVFGSFYDNDYFIEHDFRPVNGMTYLNLYDITDRAEPALGEEYKFEGSYFNGRMQDGTMYVLVQSSPNTIYPMPVFFEGGVLRTVAVDRIAYFPLPYDYPQFVTVHALPIGGGEVESRTITVEGGNTLYMSPQNIYLAYTETVNEWQLRNDIMKDVLEPRLSAAERSRIEKIRSADPEVLSEAEKESKVLQVYQEHVQWLRSDEQQQLEKDIDSRLKEKLEEYEAFEYTIIHKIDAESLAVSATGKVPGRLNNQFAMDEYEGNLRVATTLSERWNGWGEPMPVDIDGGIGDGSSSASTDAAEPEADAAERRIAPAIMPPRPSSESKNNVYVLDEGLAVIGELEGLAPGEQIYSTRFIGERLYMVTFRQVDPFFVIDLSDPSNPEELGELKIPGFSRYLHPYDEDTIIGIGRDATELGRQQGLKIALFDVSDVSAPRELAQWVSEEEYAQSQAEWEHKAFLFDREKELLVIPAYSYEWDYKGGGKEQYNGAMVFALQRDDIELRGIVDHSEGKQQYWGQLVERSLYIEEMLYTKSPGLLRVNLLEDLSSVQNVTLSGKNASPYPIY